MAVTIDVFGSRVSRDLFRYVQSGKYQYRRCITGIPITTLYEKALNFQQDHFNGVGLDEYEQAVLKLQTMKIVPHILKKKKSDYLIIDLADELLKRFELISSDGINQLAYPEEKEAEYEAFLKKEKVYTLTKKYLPTEMEQRLIERKYKQFASELLYSKDNPDGYRPEQIIILEALYAGDILTNEGAIKQT